MSYMAPPGTRIEYERLFRGFERLYKSFTNLNKGRTVNRIQISFWPVILKNNVKIKFEKSLFNFKEYTIGCQPALR